MPLIDELYDLSDNTALFGYLRKGGELTALTKSLAGATFTPKGRKTELLASVREVLLPALEGNDCTALHKLIRGSDTNARVTVLGELILTLYALSEGAHSGAPVDAVLETALQTALDLARAFEDNPPQDTNDVELFYHGVAMREWAHLFSRYYRAKGVPAYEAELLMVRARATNTSLTTWAFLVGAAMIDIARVLEPIGKTELATRCYHGIRMDLRYLLKREDVFAPFERGCALYWLQRACEERIRLVPDDAEAASDLQEVRKLRRERGFPDAISEPRFGPIARTYLDRIPYLALVIRDIETNYDKERESESVAAICNRYGCLSTDVEFYVSAIGSYHLRRTVLAGVHTMYDAAHEEVFAALDYLAQQRKSEKKS